VTLLNDVRIIPSNESFFRRFAIKEILFLMTEIIFLLLFHGLWPLIK
jgi:hypothetical protein